VASEGDAVGAVLRAGVLPGRVVVEASADGFSPVHARLETTSATSDRFGDGTPDWLRLDDEADRQAFRRWTTYLAELQYFREPEKLPIEVSDCAALLRFAFRETLREHTGAWAEELGLEGAPWP